MSTKAKLRLRHIEDADKSKITAAAPEPAAPKLVASAAPLTDSKKTNNLAAELHLTAESGSGSEVGAALRRGRLEKDLSLQDVAQQLRIQRSYLQALETGDFDNLPGLTYAIGYVRSYSQLVGLDAEKLITDFKAEAKKLQEPTQLSFPSPAPEGKVPGGALMFVGVLLAALSYGGWYYFSTSETAVSDLTPAIPDRLAFLLEEPAIKTETAETTSSSPEQDRQPEAATVAELAEPAPVQPAESAPVADAPATAVPAPAPIEAAEAEAPKPVAQEPEQVATAPAEKPADVADVPAATEPTASKPAVAAPTPAEPAVETASVPETAPVQADAPAAPEPAETAAGTEPAEQPSEQPVEQVASAPVAAPAPAVSDIPAVPEVSRSGSEQSAVNAEAAAIDSKPAPAPAASSQGPRIVISATDDSWVQVRGSDAAPLLTRILRKGEQYEVPARNGLRLFTGNAGALKISVNGTEAPSLGPFGKIARNVPLDESLLSYTVSD